MKPDTFLHQLLLAFDQKTQQRYPQHASLIKCLVKELLDYHYDKSVLEPNYLEWLITINNALPAYEHQGHSIQSIQFVHELLRKQLANYDKAVKKANGQNVQEVDFMAEYGFHNYSLIKEHIQVATSGVSTRSNEAAASEFLTLFPHSSDSSCDRSNMSPQRRFSFLSPASARSEIPASLSPSNG